MEEGIVPDAQRLCLRAVGELAAECLVVGFSPKANISTPYALKASFQNYGWDMRTRHRAMHDSKLSSSPLQPKRKNNRQPQGLSVIFWSKWRVSEGKTVDNCFTRRARAGQGVGGGDSPHAQRLCLRAVGELAAARRDFRLWRIFSRLPLMSKLNALCAENANSPSCDAR